MSNDIDVCARASTCEHGHERRQGRNWTHIFSLKTFISS